MRVVSLLPSATEIVYALGLGDQLVGVTFECDEPASARRDKTVVVGGRDTSGMTPAAIDAYVRARLAAGEDLYTLHAGALAALAPELILTQDLCRVCALPGGHVEEALDYLGCTARSSLLTRTASTTCSRRSSPSVSTPAPSLRPKSWSPCYGNGSQRSRDGSRDGAGPPLLSSSGPTRPSLPGTGSRTSSPPPEAGRSVQATWERIAAARPEVVVVAPCGFHLDGAAAQAELAARHLPGIPVWAIDADGLVVRPGPRLVDGVEALAAMLHPDPAVTVPAGRIRRIA